MQCPRDNTPTEHVRIDAHFQTLVLDVCPTCMGVWFDRHELVQIVTLYDVLHARGVFEKWKTVDAVSASQHTTARLEPALSCPHGHGVMHRNPYAGDSTMYIDRCEVCKGVWFDGGEAVRLWDTIAPNPIHDTLVLAFSQQKNLQKEYYWEKLLGNTDFSDALHTAEHTPGGFAILLSYLLARMFLRHEEDGADTSIGT